MTKLSDTQRVILSKAAQHEALLAELPGKLPAAARQAVLRSMISKGLLEEVPAPREAIALAAAKARGTVLGGDRGYRPPVGPDAAAAALARRVAAERAAHRLSVELARLRAEGIEGNAALARALNASAVPTPRGRGTWTHTSVARVMMRTARCDPSGVFASLARC